MTIPPVVKTIRVDITPQAAFALFTSRIGEWWPLSSHSVSGNAGHTSIELEMSEGIGGELVETGHDGTRHVWGRIEEWAPGQALTLTWHPGRSDGAETQVRITFEADGEGTTLTLTHSNWENLGAEGAKTRDGYDQGWNSIMEQFAQAA